MENKKILIPKIGKKIEEKLRELSLKPEVSPQKFLKIYKENKHRYFSPCFKNEEIISFYARLHNNLDAKEKFIREISFLKKIKKSDFQIKKRVPKILGYGVEKEFEWMAREYLKAPPLGLSRKVTLPPSKNIINSLVKSIFEILKVKPEKLNLKLKKFDYKNYLAPGTYQDLIEKRLIPKELAQKILKMIKSNSLLLKKEGHYFCHGDLNLGNILSDRKEIWIVDWELIHLNNFAFDIGYLWAHLWEAKKSFRKNLMKSYLRNLSRPQIQKFRKLLPVVVSYFSLGGIAYKKKKERLKTLKKRRGFYINLLKNCLHFTKLVEI